MQRDLILVVSQSQLVSALYHEGAGVTVLAKSVSKKRPVRLWCASIDILASEYQACQCAETLETETAIYAGCSLPILGRFTKLPCIPGVRSQIHMG
jgi:hypothetical protein